MGRIFTVELLGRHYKCRNCATPLALPDHVLSKNFRCHRGKAYFISTVVNVTFGVLKERSLSSCLYKVEDMFCCCCGQYLGWKYLVAEYGSQRYKEGKFFLERWRISF